MLDRCGSWSGQSGFNRNSHSGESWIIDCENGLEAPAYAADRESAIVVGGCRLGPGEEIDRVVPRKTGTFELPVNGSVDRADRDFDIPSGLALEVEKPALDDLFGTKRDVGGGLFGIRVEVGPADPIAGRASDNAK